jgi:hypothetical protein
MRWKRRSSSARLQLTVASHPFLVELCRRALRLALRLTVGKSSLEPKSGTMTYRFDLIFSSSLA